MEASSSTKWWNESDLDDLVNGLKFSASLKNLSILKKCYYNFYNLYLEGQFPEKGWSVQQVVFPTITALWKEGRNNKLEEPYFPEDQFEGEGFYQLGEPEKCSSTLSEGDTYNSRSSGTEFVEREKTFRTTIKRVLESWDTTKPVTQEIKIFQNMTAMLALGLMRVMVLTESQLERHFRHSEFVTNLHKLTKWAWANGYAPPHQKCIFQCWWYFDKRRHQMSTMFAMILSRWKSECRAATADLTAHSIIEMGLLNRTKFNGLGLVELTLLAKQAIGIELPQMCETTVHLATNETWRIVSKFIQRYIDGQAPGDTFYWARVLDDKCLHIFASKYDPFYAGIMAGIIMSQQPRNSFENATWFKNNVLRAQEGFKLGKHAFSCWKDKSQQLNENHKE